MTQSKGCNEHRLGIQGDFVDGKLKSGAEAILVQVQNFFTLILHYYVCI